MSRLGEQTKLLDLLSETPIISLACKKAGISRATYYRWFKDNKHFREQADKVLSLGRKHINDMAESVLIKEINRGNMVAVRFWLQNNHEAYIPKRTNYVEIKHDHYELKPGETCYSCGYVQPRGGLRVVSSSIYEDLESEKTKKLSRKDLLRKVMENLADKKAEASVAEFFAFHRDESKKDAGILEAEKIDEPQLPKLTEEEKIELKKQRDDGLKDLPKSGYEQN